MFNSNSPEVVQSEGILLSTFPPKEMKFPAAHLNHSLKGSFSIFFHHISNGLLTKSNRTVFIGIIAHNPSQQNAILKINRAAAYLSQPDAPFKSLPPAADNAQGDVYAGPGDRVMSDYLHEKASDPIWQQSINIPPHRRVLSLRCQFRSRLWCLLSTGYPECFLPVAISQSTLLRWPCMERKTAT
jgi:hypothetical protein